MTEEKDDFLREIDELLGGIEDEPASSSVSLANGSSREAMEDVDPELEETFKVLSVESNNHVAVPKSGLVKAFCPEYTPILYWLYGRSAGVEFC